MASIPMDQDNKALGGGKPPVSAHPAFPAIVALWFAALFGLGSLILPAQMFENFVTASGISSLVPAAAPPLGFTARAIIALAATVFGAVLGLVAARRIAAPRSKAIAGKDRFSKSARAPLNAIEDLGEDSIEPAHSEVPADEDAPAASGRRRSLAIAESDGPSEFLTLAPLPGADEPLDLAEEVEIGEFVEVEAESAEAPRQEFVASELSENEDASIDEERTEPFNFAERSDSREQTFEPLAFSPPSIKRETEAEEIKQDDCQDDESAPPQLEQANEKTLSEKQIFQPVPQAAADQSPETTQPVDSAPVPAEEEQRSACTNDEEMEDSLGLVQLVQKLGSALEKHREWSAQRAVEPQAVAEAPTTEAPQSFPQDFDAARPDDAAEAMAAYFSKPDEAAEAAVVEGEPKEFVAPEAGEAYAPFAGSIRIDDDDEEDEDDISDLAASFSLPLSENVTHVTPRPTARPSIDIAASNAAETDVEEDVPEESASTAHKPARDASYESLSGVSNPFKSSADDFVRIDDEPEHETARPAVVFPHQEARQSAPAPSPVDSDAQEASARDNVARPFDPPASAGTVAEARKPASNDDNERALRDALMNLQRMGK